MVATPPRVGVLDLQGAGREHLRACERCGALAVAVKRTQDLAGVDALVIPGGESTAIGRLMQEYGFLAALAGWDRPLFGTCAGLILLARQINDSSQPRLGLMDLRVERNAFGRQRESFEADLEVPVLGEAAFRAVFIRAPYIQEAGAGVQVLARFEGKIVLARQGVFLAAAFHPELTDDLRLHRYFLSLLPWCQRLPDSPDES